MKSILFFLGLSLTPVYIFESGGLQISHTLFLLFSLLVIFSASNMKYKIPLLIFVLFVSYVWLREFIAFLVGSPIETFLPAMHFTYSLLIFICVQKFFRSQEKVKWLQKSLSVSVCIAVLGVLYFGYGIKVSDDSGRAIGTFNNPNQLGYYSVLVFAIASILHLTSLISNLRYIVLIVAAFFLAVVSLSKAAVLSIAIGPFFLLLRMIYSYIRSRDIYKIPLKNFWIGLFLITSAIIISIVNYEKISSIALDDFAIIQRITNMADEQDTDLTVRGYGIYEEANSIEKIFGISSYNVSLRMRGSEIHSTLMSQITYYGLLGGGVFVSFYIFWLIFVYRKFGLFGFMFIALPITLYGITHNGGRFTMFWILLGLTFSLPISKNILVNPSSIKK